VKTVRPGSDATVMRPPCCRTTMLWETVRPRPVPPRQAVPHRQARLHKRHGHHGDGERGEPPARLPITPEQQRQNDGQERPDDHAATRHEAPELEMQGHGQDEHRDLLRQPEPLEPPGPD
jgi:hypothetical protein